MTAPVEVQEAVVAAHAAWTVDGLPGAPRAWLRTVATRRLVDDLLVLCCHPALSPPSQLALMLRAVSGLSTAAIAQALLVPEATVGSASRGPRRASARRAVASRCPGRPSWRRGCRSSTRCCT